MRCLALVFPKALAFVMYFILLKYPRKHTHNKVLVISHLSMLINHSFRAMIDSSLFLIHNPELVDFQDELSLHLQLRNLNAIVKPSIRILLTESSTHSMLQFVLQRLIYDPKLFP
mmetsp:Transcript_3809/g.5983  ORF Transcript_3809/g.5983 Transcript_3809/m.5983 type:complete len:115 (+) Transcript_3809:968-1312(+)